MKRSSVDFGILDFSKKIVILYVMQQNATLMWHHSHKSYALQGLNVSAHHWVTTWTSWHQQPFYWNWNTNAWGGETVDWSARDEELKKRWRSRSVSSPKNATGQVFAILRALDTISMFASPSQCITLIPEADNWDPSISRNACLLCLCRRKSPFFTINGLWTDGTIFLPSLPLLHLICLLPFVEGTK